ncbi:MAG: hypothetical protein K2J83_01440 [Clostridia bacterium]|nr:hypothetical protein [Clostridia bacterium]
MEKSVQSAPRKNGSVGKNVRLYYGIALSVMTAVCGAFFIAAVWNVYLSGEGFSRERLVESINTFALVPFIIWVVMCFVGWVLWEVYPPESKRYKNDVRYNLYRQKKRMPDTVSEELKASFEAVKREEKTVKILWMVASVICLAAAVYTVVYLCLPSSFPSVENKSIPVFTMVKRVLPVVLAAFAVCCGVAVYEGKSAKKQLKEVQKLTVGEKVKIKPNLWTKWRDKAVQKADKRFYAGLVKFMDFNGKHYVAIIRIAVACVCVAFVIAGIFNEGMNQMLQKAIIICSECIGLG